MGKQLEQPEVETLKVAFQHAELAVHLEIWPLVPKYGQFHLFCRRAPDV